MDLLVLEQQLSRLQKLTADEKKFMSMVCAHVTNGGSLIELCQVMDISYGHVMEWIKENQPREKRYCDALHDRTEWVKERLLMELRRIGLADIRKIYNENGTIKDPHEWPDEVASFVSSIECVEEFEGKGSDKEQVGWNKKVKLWNKEKALELLGKNLSLFIERHEVKVTTLEDVIGASWKDVSDDGETDNGS